MTKMKTAMKKVMKPALPRIISIGLRTLDVIRTYHVSHPSRENVLIEENPVIRAADTNANTTVQAPWSERALKAVSVETIPAAVMRVWARRIMIPHTSRPNGPHSIAQASARATALLVEANCTWSSR